MSEARHREFRSRQVVVAAGVPVFTSEEEETKWLDEHPEFIRDLFLKAAAEGRLKPRSERFAEQAAVPQRSPAINITIRFQRAEIERVRRLAEKKGLRYQTYIKMLLREALDRAEAGAG